MIAIARTVLLGAAILSFGMASAADPLPRFTEEREAAAIHFIRKQCPELVPLLDELKKSNRATYELQIRETFQVTELLAELQDDTKRYDLELKMWKAENKALVLVAKLATPRDDDRKVIEGQLQALAKELVELELQSLEKPRRPSPERTGVVQGRARQVPRQLRPQRERPVRRVAGKGPEEETVTVRVSGSHIPSTLVDR
jgi:hypothetical protein